MFTTLVPFLAAAFTPQTPTTVNGHVLGTAEEFATHGPAHVCFQDMIIALENGDTVYVEYLGIHDGRLSLLFDDGAYVRMRYGDAFVDQRDPGQEPAIQRPGQNYYQVGDKGSPFYQMVDPTRDTNVSRQILFLSGTALTGDQSDLKVFERLSFDAEYTADCDRSFGFGWDGIFWSTPARDASE